MYYILFQWFRRNGLTRLGRLHVIYLELKRKWRKQRTKLLCIHMWDGRPNSEHVIIKCVFIDNLPLPFNSHKLPPCWPTLAATKQMKWWQRRINVQNPKGEPRTFKYPGPVFFDLFQYSRRQQIKYRTLPSEYNNLLRRPYMLGVWSLYKTSLCFRMHCTIKEYERWVSTPY